METQNIKKQLLATLAKQWQLAKKSRSCAIKSFHGIALLTNFVKRIDNINKIVSWGKSVYSNRLT